MADQYSGVLIDVTEVGNPACEPVLYRLKFPNIPLVNWAPQNASVFDLADNHGFQEDHHGLQFPGTEGAENPGRHFLTSFNYAVDVMVKFGI